MEQMIYGQNHISMFLWQSSKVLYGKQNVEEATGPFQDLISGLYGIVYKETTVLQVFADWYKLSAVIHSKILARFLLRCYDVMSM